MTDSDQALALVDDKREKTIALLSERFAQGALAMDEFERRVEEAHRADTVAGLATLMADLAPAVRAVAKEQALAPHGDRSLVGEQPETELVLTVFGGSTRKGHWTVPRRLRTAVVMGGVDLDFREAKFGPGVHELRVHACMGAVDIVVPPDVGVDCSGIPILGAFDMGPRDDVASHPDRPVLRICGVVFMGAVDVQTRLPGESKREARKRRKRELKEKQHKLLSDQ